MADPIQPQPKTAPATLDPLVLPPKKPTGLIVTLVIVIILAVAAVAGTWYYMNKKLNDQKAQQQQQIDAFNKQIEELKSQPQQTAAPDATANWTQFTSKLFDYKYPSNELFLVDCVATFENTFLYQINLKGQKGVQTATCGQGDGPTQITIGMQSSENIQYFENARAGQEKMISSTEYSIGGKKGKKIVKEQIGQESVYPVGTKEIFYITPVGSKYFVGHEIIANGYAGLNLGDYSATFEQIVNTVKFK